MRVAAFTVLAACALLVSSCGNSPAEEAFLADLQKSSSFTELPDPDGDLDRGHTLCELLEKTKPADRSVVGAIAAQQPGFSFPILFAAERHLCPQYAS